MGLCTCCRANEITHPISSTCNKCYSYLLVNSKKDREWVRSRADTLQHWLQMQALILNNTTSKGKKRVIPIVTIPHIASMPGTYRVKKPKVKLKRVS